MKKICLFIMFLVLCVVGTQVFADVVTTRRLTKPQAQTTPSYNKTTVPTTQTGVPVQKRKTQSKLANNLQTCMPYSEQQTYDVGGVNFLFNVKIVGWVNNKCRLDFESKMGGIASSFSSLYGIDPSSAEIQAFTPKIRCEFTKQQLVDIGDSILQEEARRNGAKNNMLKNPNSINIVPMSQLNSSDQKLFELVMGGTACKMQGGEDLDGIINSIFGY